MYIKLLVGQAKSLGCIVIVHIPHQLIISSAFRHEKYNRVIDSADAASRSLRVSPTRE